jgi:hypothetical protein
MNFEWHNFPLQMPIQQLRSFLLFLKPSYLYINLTASSRVFSEDHSEQYRYLLHDFQGILCFLIQIGHNLGKIVVRIQQANNNIISLMNSLREKVSALYIGELIKFDLLPLKLERFYLIIWLKKSTQMNYRNPLFLDQLSQIFHHNIKQLEISVDDFFPGKFDIF